MQSLQTFTFNKKEHFLSLQYIFYLTIMNDKHNYTLTKIGVAMNNIQQLTNFDKPPKFTIEHLGKNSNIQKNDKYTKQEITRMAYQLCIECVTYFQIQMLTIDFGSNQEAMKQFQVWLAIINDHIVFLNKLYHYYNINVDTSVETYDLFSFPYMIITILRIMVQYEVDDHEIMKLYEWQSKLTTTYVNEKQVQKLLPLFHFTDTGKLNPHLKELYEWFDRNTVITETKTTKVKQMIKHTK